MEPPKIDDDYHQLQNEINPGCLTTLQAAEPSTEVILPCKVCRFRSVGSSTKAEGCKY